MLGDGDQLICISFAVHALLHHEVISHVIADVFHAPHQKPDERLEEHHGLGQSPEEVPGAIVPGQVCELVHEYLA